MEKLKAHDSRIEVSDCERTCGSGLSSIRTAVSLSFSFLKLPL